MPSLLLAKLSICRPLIVITGLSIRRPLIVSWHYFLHVWIPDPIPGNGVLVDYERLPFLCMSFSFPISVAIDFQYCSSLFELLLFVCRMIWWNRSFQLCAMQTFFWFHACCYFNLSATSLLCKLSVWMFASAHDYWPTMHQCICGSSFYVCDSE